MGEPCTATRHPDMASRPEHFAAVEREAARIAQALDIPPCPAILAEFNRASRLPQPDLRRLAALIGCDAGLSATVLKTVNSPFYGLAKKAAGIEQALAVLGLRPSANLIRGLLLRRAFPAALPQMQRYWDSALLIARLAAALAARLRGLDPDIAHTYVLFRDCGMLVMLRRFPKYADLMEQGSRMPGAQFTRVEDTRFQFNHARVACALARSWSLPDSLCAAIFCHHEFALAGQHTASAAPADRRLIAFGLLAEQIAALHLDRGLCPDWPGAERFVLATLGIAAEEIVELAEALRDPGL
jgi:HD-like signal output (HDOD) protein